MELKVTNSKNSPYHYLWAGNIMVGSTTKPDLYAKPEKWFKQQVHSRTQRIDDRIRCLNRDIERLINEREFLTEKPSGIKCQITGIDLKFKWERKNEQKQKELRRQYESLHGNGDRS